MIDGSVFMSRQSFRTTLYLHAMISAVEAIRSQISLCLITEKCPKEHM